MGALVVLAAQAGAIEPGAEAETVVLVRNTGDSPDTFHVVVQGEASAWAVVDPPSVTLDPGAEAPVWVHFRPPRAPDTAPGPVPFDIAVASLADPGFLALETGTIQVGTYASVAATFDGEAVAGPRWTDLAVRVRNTGNRRVTISVEAEAASPDVVFEIDPPSVALVAGQAAEVRVRVRPPRRILPRKADRHLTVSVVSDGGALATLRTEYAQDPSLADELFRSARVLLVVLVLVFLGGLALLRSEPLTGDAGTGSQPAILPVAPTAPPEEEEEGEAPDEAAPVDEPPPVTVAPVAEPATGPPPPLPRMVFVRAFGPDARDLVVREPGTRGAELRLRTDGALESRPRLSPDGAHVAFIRERDGTARACVVAAAGGEPACVAETTVDAAVAWSGDGGALFFSRGGRLFSVSYDTSSQVAGNETDTGIAVPSGRFALSPDATRVVTAEGRRLVVHRLDGGAPSSIEVPDSAEDPSFSPDGTRLLFTSAYHLFSAPVGGGPVRQLTAPGTVNGEGTWTAAGDWVVFRSNRSGVGDLYCLKGSSSGGAEIGLAQITSTDEREVTPSF